MLVVNKDPSVDGTQDAGVAFSRAFYYIKKNVGAARGVSFITDVSCFIVLQ